VIDVLIIGAGPAGSTLAALLARDGYSVTIVEKAAFPRAKVCGEYLSPPSLAVFERLGLLDQFLELAGPVISRVAAFHKGTVIEAQMPERGGRHGRALRREVLDQLLLDNAIAAGAKVIQPAAVISAEKDGDGKIRSIIESGLEQKEIVTDIAVAAHGSWTIGKLHSQQRAGPPRPSDLVAFKTHFRGSSLPNDTMAILALPSGYGGMVTCDSGHTSFSFCIKRDALAAAREMYPSSSTGESAFEYIRSRCKGLDDAVAGAQRSGEWLSAGVIRPGRHFFHDGTVYAVGNAAGESHAVIADGITMAIRSAMIFRDSLVKVGWREPTFAHEYERQWRRAFNSRISYSKLIALLSMSPIACDLLSPFFRLFPSLLTAGAVLAGKSSADKHLAFGSSTAG